MTFDEWFKQARPHGAADGDEIIMREAWNAATEEARDYWEDRMAECCQNAERHYTSSYYNS